MTPQTGENEMKGASIRGGGAFSDAQHTKDRRAMFRDLVGCSLLSLALRTFYFRVPSSRRWT